ncbi:hypothetical protein ACFY93_28740 [Streptomyces sp. NPDC008313]|uniref:hypothetical protein n=1 Tax=Streptomyces sp. NPDC008313 TaxID=3364826 RepID=UPI0036E14738
MLDDPVQCRPGEPTGVSSRDDAVERVRAVADAILYEGYLLYPYRRSSPKNRVRWQFGVLAPRDWVEADGPVAPGISGSVESWCQQTECLMSAEADATVRVRVRHLQLQHKQVERCEADGRHVAVESLEADGTVHVTFDEAVPRETTATVPLAELLTGERTFAVGAPAGEETEPLPGGHGRTVRRRRPLEARAVLRAERLTPAGARPATDPRDGARAHYRLRVRVENTAPSPGRDVPRSEALRHALVATHTVLGGDGVAFLSLTDPPEGFEAHARACRNLHTFPVLAGDEGAYDLMLSSPIILPDRPRVAPESPGDLHDAAEIDEILTLRTLLLTDEEKREARATDRRAADILDRVEAMPPEVLSRLHGAIRSLKPSPVPAPAGAPEGPPRASVPWWEEGGDDGLSPSTDSVLVDGVALRRGSAVRLCPSGRGADAHDMFLVGRSAHVTGVFHDVDGSVRLAVTLDDDPAAELNGWYGRFHYFRPEEVTPLDAAPDEEGRDGRHRAVDA